MPLGHAFFGIATGEHASQYANALSDVTILHTMIPSSLNSLFYSISHSNALFSGDDFVIIVTGLLFIVVIVFCNNHIGVLNIRCTEDVVNRVKRDAIIP